MDIHIYVRDDQGEEHKVGRMLCSVVPRIGETVYLRMSLKGEWRLNPNNRVRLDTAYFHVDDVAYDGYNIAEMEPGMGAAPYAQGSAVNAVQLYVHATNEDTQVYIDRIIRCHGTQGDEHEE